MSFEDHSDLIRAIADKNGVPAGLVESILALEPAHRNLHAWGGKPALRRALEDLVDAAKASRTPDE